MGLSIITKMADFIKDKKKFIKIFAVFIMTGLMVFMVFFFFVDYRQNSPKLDNGTLSLASWNEQADGIIPLSGKWEFYWNRFITYDQINQGLASPDLFANVPSVWNNYKVAGNNLPGFGFCTYTLKVTGAKKGEQLALWVPTFSTAYRLYIGGSLVASNGVVSTQKSKGVAYYNPQVAVFTPSSSEFDIVIQVSNYSYARGGMWYTLYLGTNSQISGIEKNFIREDFFLLGSFIVMGFAFQSIYFLRRQEKSSMYFAILCLIAICHTLINGSYSINTLFPFVGYEAVVRLEYMTVTFYPGVLCLLAGELFPKEIGKKTVKIFIGYELLVTFIVLATPIMIFTRLANPIQMIGFAILVYLATRITTAILRGRAEAPIFLVSLIAIMVGTVYDTLYQNNIISGGYIELTPIAFSFMLMLEAYVLARRFTIALKEKETAFTALQISVERERNTELKFLKSQIRPHFLHNSLNTIISVSRKDTNRSRGLLIEFSKYLRGCFDFNNLDDVIPIENELGFIRSYIVLEQARFGEKLRVEYDIEETGLTVPPLVLQPLVENAVVHGIMSKPEGGIVLIYVKHSGSLIRLGVKDNGCGIPDEKADRILNGMESTRGVGINNINFRLQRLYGTSLQIKNICGGGVDVFMELPLSGKEN